MPAPRHDPTPRKRGRAGQRDRARRLVLYPLCRRCDEQGLVTATQVINHVIPLAKGGPDTDQNCEGLCEPCHQIVTAEQFGFEERPVFGLDGWAEGD